MKSFSGFLLIGLLVQTAFAELRNDRQYAIASIQDSEYRRYAILLNDPELKSAAYSFAQGSLSEDKMNMILNSKNLANNNHSLKKIKKIEECIGSNCIPVFGLYAGRSPN